MQNDYSNYSVNDFVWDEDFRSWALHPTGVTDLYWKEWLALHPEQHQDVEAAKEIVLALKIGIKKIDAEEYAVLVNDTVDKATGRRKYLSGYFRASLIAASFIALMIAGYLYVIQNNKQQFSESPAKSFSFKNNSDTAMMVRLPDGTEILLDSRAFLKIDSSFNVKNRKTYLSGNAFFKVAHDSSKPFFVYCENVETKVLGTSFKIQSDTVLKKIQVIVHSGIVSVSMPEKLKGRPVGAKTIVVTRNQQADYSLNTGTLYKTIAVNPVESEENFISFIYDAKPVYDIFSDLEKAYDITILYDKNIIPDHVFSGNLEGKTLQEKIKVICHALGFNYKIEDAKIIVY